MLQPENRGLSVTPLENSAGAENSAENWGTNGQKHFCSTYDLNLHHGQGSEN